MDLAGSNPARRTNLAIVEVAGQADSPTPFEPRCGLFYWLRMPDEPCLMSGDFTRGEFPADSVREVWVQVFYRARDSRATPDGFVPWTKSHTTWRDEWDDYGDSGDLCGPWRSAR